MSNIGKAGKFRHRPSLGAMETKPTAESKAPNVQGHSFLSRPPVRIKTEVQDPTFNSANVVTITKFRKAAMLVFLMGGGL